jgi:hypothetical protein
LLVELVPSWEGNRDSAVVCLGPSGDKYGTAVYYTGLTRSGKFLAFAVKLFGDFTGSRVSAGSQRVRQRREFNRDIDPLRWELGGEGLKGLP